MNKFLKYCLIGAVNVGLNAALLWIFIDLFKLPVLYVSFGVTGFLFLTKYAMYDRTGMLGGQKMNDWKKISPLCRDAELDTDSSPWWGVDGAYTLDSGKIIRRCRFCFENHIEVKE